MEVPLPQSQLDRLLKQMDIRDLSKATIRQCTAVGTALVQADDIVSNIGKM